MQRVMRLGWVKSPMYPCRVRVIAHRSSLIAHRPEISHFMYVRRLQQLAAHTARRNDVRAGHVRECAFLSSLRLAHWRIRSFYVPCSLNGFIALEGAWKKARGDVLVEGAHIDPFLKSPRTQNQHRTLYQLPPWRCVDYSSPSMSCDDGKKRSPVQ